MKRFAVAAFVTVVASLALALCAGVQAQAFPSKPVRIIVAFPPGGGTDIVARLLVPKLTESWGQQVIVDNRAGASGVIGTEIAARSPADGSTLFLGTLGNLAVNQHLYPKMTVDPLRDFAPVTQVVAVHLRHGGESRPAGAERRRADRARQGPAREDQLLVLRARRGAAPRGRAVQEHGESEPGARAVQGQRGGFQDLLAGRSR